VIRLSFIEFKWGYTSRIDERQESHGLALSSSRHSPDAHTVSRSPAARDESADDTHGSGSSCGIPGMVPRSAVTYLYTHIFRIIYLMTSEAGNVNASATGQGAVESEFRGDVVETCETFINEFARGEKAKVDTIKSIYNAIFTSDGDAEGTEGMREAQDISFANFLDKIEEVCQTRVSAAHRGKAPQAQFARQDVPDAEEGDDAVDEFLDNIRRERSPSVILDNHTSNKRARSTSSERAPRTSKKPFVEALLPFIANRQSRVSVNSLRPDLRETIRCKELYGRDVAAAKQVLTCQPDCPDIPDPVWNDILLSKFVDLDRIFSSLQSIDGDAIESYKVGDLELSAGPTKPKKHIATAGEWLSAYERYKRGVVFCYPHRERELTDYAFHINRQFTAVGEVNTTRVIHYDRAVRAEASRGNRLLLTDLHEWNHLYTAFIVTPGAVTKNATSTSRGKDNRSNEACQCFNQGRCTNRNNCRFRHVCSLCSSKEHMVSNCPKLLRPSIGSR
ncbi:hypothetical protein BDY19DRAFT_321373, partial [Irpex rosettiformis]